MKRCTRCLEDKDETFFVKKGKGYNSYCKTCQKTYWKDYYSNPENRQRRILASKRIGIVSRKERLQFIDSLKDKPCKDCLGKFPVWVMQFDHLPGTIKKWNVSEMRHCSEQTILEEVAKCDIVCANCHANRTYLRRKHV